MRIIGGKLRHRLIEEVHLPTTRETQDKVRQAIFNMIGPYFDGGTVLDLFAGSGALAIEAYLRCMSFLYFNDKESQAIQTVKKNCCKLNITDFRCFTLDYNDFFRQQLPLFDLIFLDPPYRLFDTTNLLEKVYPHTSKDAVIVVELAKESAYPLSYCEFYLEKDKTYGIKRILIYRRHRP